MLLAAIATELKERGCRVRWGGRLTERRISQNYLDEPPHIEIYFTRYYEMNRPTIYTVKLFVGPDKVVLRPQFGLRPFIYLPISDPTLFDQIIEQCK